ncbi:S1C family serine protease [Virgibacillus ainsalahensis]
MQEKRYPPIIISILILITGIIAFIVLYNHWTTKEVSVNNPIINQLNTDTGAPDLKSIIYEAEKNVIQIEGQNENSTVTGSGFLYNEHGDIVTNAHVINDADVIYVRTSDAQIYPAAVVGASESTDIAVIRVPQLAGQSFSSLEEKELAEIGDEVIALGSPHGFQNTVTLGIISGNARNFSLDGYSYSNTYQISAPITHGNSGGPLISRQTGKVIGINSVGTQDGTIGFSIPIVEVIDQIKQWSNEAQNKELDFAGTDDMINTNRPEKFKEDAEYLVDYFLESISIRDYVNAYTLLGSSLQSEMTYSEFRDKYIQIVALSYSNLKSSVTDSNQIRITSEVEIESNLQNEDDTIQQSYENEFIIGYENDQLKILNISTEE